MLIGFPRMHKEAGELRDFLPGFIAYVAHLDVAGVVVEEGYGSGMGFRMDNYLRGSPKVTVGTNDECLTTDVVITLRSPDEDELRHVERGAIALAMFHYPTNIHRTQLLADRAVHAVSLDSIVDDHGRRLIENIDAVGWNGIEAAFRELARSYPDFQDPRRPPIHATVLGTGAVAGAAAFAAARYGDHDLRGRLVAHGVRGVEITMLDHDLTCDEEYMLARLTRTDVLVDATRRPDRRHPAIPNRWLATLPDHTVILDLAADPYDFSTTPPSIKAIEGVPHGTLDRYVFAKDDPAYENLTDLVDTTHKRVALSCYSWPGIHPRASMERYGAQLEPVIDVVLSRPPEHWDIASENHMERAIARAEVTRWMHMASQSR